MRAGTLKHRVLFEQLSTGSPTQNAGGEIESSWAAFKTLWASVSPLKGRELVAAQQISAEVTGVIKIRYNALVTASMRAVFEGRVYDILAVIDPEEAHREMWCYTKQGVSNG